VNLWAQAVAEAGTDEPAAVRQAVRNQRFEAPEGLVWVDPDNLHTWKVARMGQVKAGGKFGVIEYAGGRQIRPEPFPTSRSREDWTTCLTECNVRWGGRWTPQTM